MNWEELQVGRFCSLIVRIHSLTCIICELSHGGGGGRTGNELGELGWRFPQGADGCISKETRVLQELRPGDWKICDYKQQVMKVA